MFPSITTGKPAHVILIVRAVNKIQPASLNLDIVEEDGKVLSTASVLPVGTSGAHFSANFLHSHSPLQTTTERQDQKELRLWTQLPTHCHPKSRGSRSPVRQKWIHSSEIWKWIHHVLCVQHWCHWGIWLQSEKHFEFQGSIFEIERPYLPRSFGLLFCPFHCNTFGCPWSCRPCACDRHWANDSRHRKLPCKLDGGLIFLKWLIPTH